MNPIAWIRQLVTSHGLEVPPELDTIIDREVEHQGHMTFTDAVQGASDTEWMNETFPSHRVASFGRLLGDDGVICLVVEDCDYPKGSVLVLHCDSWPGTEVDEDYPSLSAWAKMAVAEIAEWERVSGGPRQQVVKG